MIELSNVSLKYDNKTTALKDITLNVDSGEFVFIVGASGAGKSSIIKLLLREKVASSGIVRVNGENIGRLKQRQIPQYRRKLGVVFQDFRLIPNMTVYDNVAFSLRVTDASTKFIRNRVPYILNLMGLEQKAKRFPNEISGGEQQRVALARALVNDPPIIIADEPTGNIDPELSYEIVELLQGINQCGTTILMVTHEQDMVRHFGGRTVTIDSGLVVFDDMIQPNEGRL
ncbi:cell division ATP-binding protein FtsE [Paludicola sp. MB14-C6]|uniref:cell division ATP-binding protein FtsE n=1 Tax=Paludihabitans sp. MB14-C6 TaxID=3070656 RepID=UPI0027DE3780|nr:cell division ATP-binding protein FtsE [Paludicola sp. MB14-C6]WMJ23569.1 cell division ATP-binding protein FtsE [Paludicola sp. MB14-C6]